MITLTDCTGMCCTTRQELDAIEMSGSISLMEACALACDADKPGQSRKLLNFMETYLRKTEHHGTVNSGYNSTTN